MALDGIVIANLVKELKDTLESARVNVLYFNVNGFEDYLRMLKACTDITGRADLYETNGTEVQAQVEQAKTAAEAALIAAGAAGERAEKISMAQYGVIADTLISGGWHPAEKLSIN